MTFLYTIFATIALWGGLSYWKYQSEKPKGYDPKTYKPREKPSQPLLAHELLAMHMKRHDRQDHRPINYLEPKE